MRIKVAGSIVGVVLLLLCTWLVVGAVGLGTYDQTHANFSYSGTWSTQTVAGDYGGTDTYSSISGNYAIFSDATGSVFRLIFLRDPGMAVITVEQRLHTGGAWVFLANCDERGAGLTQAYCEFSLPYETWDFRFTHSGTGTYADIDAFQVVNDSTPTPTATGTATATVTRTITATVTLTPVPGWTPMPPSVPYPLDSDTILVVTQWMTTTEVISGTVSTSVSLVNLAADSTQIFGVMVGYLLVIALFLFVNKFQQWALILAMIGTLAWVPFSITGLSVAAAAMVLFGIIITSLLRALSNFWK